MILVLLLQAKLGKYQSNLKTKSLQYTDSRISLLTQILIGIRIWKLNGWEERFATEVKEIREQELSYIRKISILSAFTTFLAISAPILITLLVFALYGAISDTSLTVSKAFTSLSLFNLLSSPLRIIPSIFVDSLNSCAALDRIYEFLDADKLPVVLLSVPKHV